MRTRVGYSGGTTAHPTYRNLGDHTECVQIDFDPTRISYRQLLDIFWNAHDPTRTQRTSRQYMTAIFCHSDAQNRMALESLDRVSAGHQKPISTRILRASPFTWAEAYHQRYMLRQHTSLFREYRQIYPDIVSFVNSTATARVNGYVGGYGGRAALMAELEGLGLSLEGARRLKDIVTQRES